MKSEPGIRIRHINIKNFKAIDSLNIDLPRPLLPSDPDVFVFGSRNGIGKTSVLEACAFGLMMAVTNPKRLEMSIEREFPIDLAGLLIRNGFDSARVELGITEGGDQGEIRAQIKRQQQLILEEQSRSILAAYRRNREEALRHGISEFTENLLLSLVSITSDPLILPPVLYFHSYRKVREGNPELGAMVDPTRYSRRIPRWRMDSSAFSLFKIEILKLQMEESGLFELPKASSRRSREHLELLKNLIKEFANGEIDKLRPRPDDTIEFRIKGGPGKCSFTFDGLSSGQKEIISLLFLISRFTSDQPSIVLIDEPELHLNAEWQLEFCNQLRKLAPQNQYILATHSRYIADSVPPERRFFLGSD